MKTRDELHKSLQLKQELRELTISAIVILTPIVYLFWDSVYPNKVPFSNDGPLGVNNSQAFQTIEYPGAPFVQDLHWLGISGQSMAGITGTIWWFCTQTSGRYVCLALCIALILFIAYAFNYLGQAICFFLFILFAPFGLMLGVALGNYGNINKLGAWYDCTVLGLLVCIMFYSLSFYKPNK